MKKIIYVFMLLFSIYPALGIENYESYYTISGDKVEIESIYGFSEPVTQVFSVQLPMDAEEVIIYVDDKVAEYSIDDGLVSLSLESVNTLQIEYVSSEPLDGSSFLLDLVMGFEASNVKIRLIIPQGMSLEEPLSQDDATAGSIYPKPDSALTDGNNLIFEWKWSNMAVGDEVPIYVKFKKRDSNYGIQVMIGIVLLLLVYNQYRKSKVKTEVKYLKEDEEVIVNILKQRDDHMCEQGTLRVITGLPKASLSRLLKELEDRNVIYKEKRGKKNLVFLRE